MQITDFETEDFEYPWLMISLSINPFIGRLRVSYRSGIKNLLHLGYYIKMHALMDHEPDKFSAEVVKTNKQVQAYTRRNAGSC